MVVMALHKRKIGWASKLYTLIAAIGISAVLLAGCAGGNQALTGKLEDEDSILEMLAQMSLGSSQFEPYYADVLVEWLGSGHEPASATIEVAAAKYAAASDDSVIETGSYAGRSDVLIWNNNRTNWIEYEVEIDEPGLYEMTLVYHSYESSGNVKNYRPVTFAVTVDGLFPFREARAIEFRKLFRDQLPIRQDEYGDDIRPSPEEIDTWLSVPFKDNTGAYAQPLLWLFEEGQHKIRLQTYQSIVIDKILLHPQETAEDYATVRQQYPQNASSGADDVVTIEAEIMTNKNDVSLQMYVDQEAMTTPKAGGKQIFNSVGGNNWEAGRETITWTFTVPEDGLYQIGMRAYQGYQTNKKVFRTIYIDGKVPFSGLYRYPFHYASNWQGIKLADENGEPYLFYLTKGEHTIAMEATIEPFTQVLNKTNGILLLLSNIAQDLFAIVGTDDDTYRTWDIMRDYPEIPENLEIVRKGLLILERDLIAVNGRDDNYSQTIRGAIRDIEDMLEYPNDIPYKKGTISSIQSKLASIQEPLMDAPLLLDKIYIVPENGEWPRMEATMLEKASNSVNKFFVSFSDNNRLSANNDQVVNVWMKYGRDYVNVLQDLADQYFTPETGIKVRVDLLPTEELIVLSNAAGKTPDIVIGVTESTPIDMAVRGAALDLSQFEDFASLSEQYAPGALLPYYFDGKYYALPESQKFNLLFYRKDILGSLGLKVPQTWEDVMTMLPTLQQNGYDFNIPQDYLTFFYQHGAEFYSKDGLKSGLDSVQGFEAFKQYTDFFTVYGIERQISSFYQHFRDGDMPIGIGDFNMYLQLSVAAPELNGWWGIAPLPGVVQEDGTIARWTGGGQQATMIFEKAENKDEAWHFMKWWLSAETQERFGSTLEGFYGIQFRWNTANVEAFSHLNWTPEELNVFLEQWRWYKDMAHVPGSYFIAREINNAWNRTVLNGQNYRASLEEAVLNINREIYRKAIEFGYLDKAGNVVKTYDLPVVDKPWEGVDRYVQ
jgi:ABC-type glycerol-3-phosphate transport system substrate-binding protein